MNRDQITKIYGPVWGAAGVNGFFGEGWEFHKKLPRFLQPDFAGMTNVYKTSTIDERPGNTPLKDDYSPKEMFPKSVYLTFWMFILGMVLNAWGLSGPGFKALLNANKWQRETKPAMISIMPVGDTPEKRREEMIRFRDQLMDRLAGFPGPVSLQANASCPNTEVNTEELAGELKDWMDILAPLKERYPNLAILVKWSADMPLGPLLKVESHPAFDGVCISNTVKFGKLPHRIPWRFIFPFSKESPLKHLGGGGLSGRVLLSLVEDCLITLRGSGFKKHINAGGGILSWRDARRLMRAGADSVFIGSVAMLRPWRVQSIIRYMNENYRQAA